MEDFDSVRWHLVTDEVKGEVNVLKEEWDSEESIKELAWCSIFDYFHPSLHLLAVGTLNEIVRVAVVHVIWPHATKFVWSTARFLKITLRIQRTILTSIVSGGEVASPIPRPKVTAAVQARANVFIAKKCFSEVLVNYYIFGYSTPTLIAHKN